MASYQWLCDFSIQYLCACHDKERPGHTKCCTCHAKPLQQTWRSDAPNCNPLSGNHWPDLRISLIKIYKHVSCTARATRNAALQVIEKLFTVHLWSANLANSRPLRPLVDTFDIVSAGGKDLRPRRPSPVSIKIAVLMDAHLPIFWPYGWRYIPTCQKLTWETSWKCDIILPRFFISTWDDPLWFSPGEGYKTSLLSRRMHQDQRNWLLLLLPRNCWCWQFSCLPSVLQLLQYPHVELTFAKVQNPLRLPQNMTVKRPKVVRTFGVFNILL